MTPALLHKINLNGYDEMFCEIVIHNNFTISLHFSQTEIFLCTDFTILVAVHTSKSSIHSIWSIRSRFFHDFNGRFAII